MTTFCRSGHWRTNNSGTTYWVSDHTVSRVDWDRFSRGDLNEDIASSPPISIYSCNYSLFVNPNATCPVCGERVYYYESSDGGKVFFDSLGPPWPKHPCVDYVVTKIKKKSQYTEWIKDLWQPYLIANVENNETCLKITGTLLRNRNELIIYVERSQNDQEKLKKNLCHIKLGDNEKICLSTFEIIHANNRLSVNEFRFNGSFKKPNVVDSVKETLKITKLPQTTLGLALRDASKRNS